MFTLHYSQKKFTNVIVKKFFLFFSLVSHLRSRAGWVFIAYDIKSYYLHFYRPYFLRHYKIFYTLYRKFFNYKALSNTKNDKYWN